MEFLNFYSKNPYDYNIVKIHKLKEAYPNVIVDFWVDIDGLKIIIRRRFERTLWREYYKSIHS